MSEGVRTILVTGAAGFIGQHVVGLFREAGHAVVPVDNFEPRVHGTDADGCTRIHAGDIPYHMLRSADIVVHLAAQVGVADSMTDPIRYVYQNTLETTELLQDLQHQCLHTRPLHKLIVASSMSVYGDPRTTKPIAETQPIAPASVYGLTKYDQERLCLLWGRTTGVPVVALRFFNVYGPGQALTNPYTGVLANFAHWLLRGESPTVYEDGQQTRDFVYVEDVADAVVRAAFTPTCEGVYNICTGTPTTIEQIAVQLAAALGTAIPPFITNTVRPGDIRHCVGSNQKFRRTCPDWAPRAFEDGIEEYATWLKKSNA